MQSAKRPRVESLQLNDLLLPISTQPASHNPIKYVVRRVPISTVLVAEALIESSHSDAATLNSLWGRFSEFSSLNDEFVATLPAQAQHSALLLLFITDIIEQGIKVSSALVYAKHIYAAAGRSGRPFQGPIYGDLLKALNMIDAAREVECAPDISVELAWRVIDELNDTNTKLTAYFLLNFGCRCADATRITADNVRFEENGSVSIRFLITKNHRKFVDRFVINVVPKKLIGELKLIASLPCGARLPLQECVVFNKALLQSPLAASLKVTSYSFRRCFIQQLIEENTSRRGVNGHITDWLAVARLTGHHDLAVLRTRYTKPFQETL